MTITNQDLNLAAMGDAAAKARIDAAVMERARRDGSNLAEARRALENELAGSSPNVTAHDFARAVMDVAFARKIKAEVTRRQASDPKFSFEDLRREVEKGAASPRTDTRSEQTADADSGITKEDFARVAIDAAAAQRISAEVNRRRKTDPTFSVEKLRIEIESQPPATSAPRRTLAPVVGINRPAVLTQAVDVEAVSILAKVARGIASADEIDRLSKIAGEIAGGDARQQTRAVLRMVDSGGRQRQARGAMFYFHRRTCEAAGVDLRNFLRSPDASDGPKDAA